MNRNPQLTPYKSSADLYELREWFYNTEKQDRRANAVSKVAAYLTRGYLPHSIESTSLLTSIILTDQKGEVDDSVLQLSYNMAIIKFVNGLLDPYQQSTFAIPLHTLLNFLKLPSYFVEIRHCGTHEFLPSLEILRIVSNKLLEWMYEHYWSEIDKKLEVKDIDEEREQFIEEMTNELKQHFKQYRKIRKLNLNKFFKYGDTTDIGSTYWNSVNGLKKLYAKDNDIFINILLTNKILILDSELNEGKTNGIRLLYRPLLEEFGLKFIKHLFEALTSLQNKGVPQGYQSTIELTQSIKWCQYFLSNEFKDQFVIKDSVDEIINILKKENNKINVSLLEYILSRDYKISLDQVQKISDTLKLMKKFQIQDDSLAGLVKEVGKDYKRPSAVDSITADLENLKKRMKLTRKIDTNKKRANQEVVLWERSTKWKPTLFGVSI